MNQETRTLRCPLYIEHEEDPRKRRIRCESPVPGSTMTMRFDTLADYNSQMGIFCCGCWEKCEVSRMVMASRYED